VGLRQTDMKTTAHMHTLYEPYAVVGSDTQKCIV